MLHDDLLDDAVSAVPAGRGAPRRSSLRRAASSAYYAMFHKLVYEATREVVSPSDTATFAAVSRVFDHTTMRAVAAAFQGTLPRFLLSAYPAMSVGPQLRHVARLFVTLQDTRHLADYDTTWRPAKADVIHLIVQARQAFSTLNTVRSLEDTRVFLLSMLFWESWRKRL